MKKIVFLDIDGVLNSNFWNESHQREISDGTLIDESKIDMLCKLVKDTDAQIILHSGWKYWFDSDLKPLRKEAENLRALLEKEGLTIAGVTPDHAPEEIKKNRKFSHIKAGEILAWLEQHNDVDAWVVLDDLDLHNTEIEKHQIRTDQSVGLTDEDVEKAKKMLCMLPTREEAEKLLLEAEECNPGPWGNHSRVAAQCAEKIAALCEGMDTDKAYILGLLHDIGRKFGVKHLGHVYDGYKYMLELGYDEVAKICLTHSFNVPDIHVYIGHFDITKEEQQEIEDALNNVVYDDYDRLIQLCDSLAGAEGVMDIEVRMADVKRRYGDYPKEKWDKNLLLMQMFEKKMGRNIYEVVGR